MDLRYQLEFYRKEHDEILLFLKEWEDALNLAAGTGEAAPGQALQHLREMEPKLLEIRQHCREEEQNVESPSQIYLDDAALKRLRQEHETLEQLSDGYRGELKRLATPPPTDALVSMGRRLLAGLRRHIAYEEGLLKQIEEGSEAEENKFLPYTQPTE